MDAGCNGFLTKPIDIDELLKTLADIAGADVSPSHEVDEPVEKPETQQKDSPDALPPTADELIYSTLNMSNPKLRAVVTKFMDRLPQQLDEMKRALQQQVFTQLADLAHWLKGSGPNVGYGDFAIHCRQKQKLFFCNF